MASAEMPSLPIQHGVRVMLDSAVSVETILLSVGKQVSYDNVAYASRMNKAVVVFLNNKRFVNRLTESGLVINDEFLLVLSSGGPPRQSYSLWRSAVYPKRRSGARAAAFLGSLPARLKL